MIETSTLTESDDIDLPPQIKEAYTHFKVLPDGRICGVHRLLYHWTMHVGIDWVGYEERYCFKTLKMAVTALDAWDGTGHPLFWHRHPESGVRRDPNTGRIWVEP